MKRMTHTIQARPSRRDALAGVHCLSVLAHATTAIAGVVSMIAWVLTGKIDPRRLSGGLLTEGIS